MNFGNKISQTELRQFPNPRHENENTPKKVSLNDPNNNIPNLSHTKHENYTIDSSS